MNITLFICNSAKGYRLGQMLADLLDKPLLDGRKIWLREVRAGKQFDFLQSCLGDDIVVFDGSVEDEKGSNYEAATSQPAMFNHVLVVSRTALPLNFTGMRCCAPNPGEAEKTNEELIAWIADQVSELNRDGLVPRQDEDKVWIPSFEVISQYQRKIQEISDRVGRRDIDHAELVGRSRKEVFISCLSKYSERSSQWEPDLGWSTERIAKRIEETGNVPRFFPPGVLSSEFLTEQRRWQIVCYIDRHMRLAKEVWIVATPDYYDSWWTQAELAELMYLKATFPQKMPQVRLFDPTSGEVRDAGDDFIKALPEKLVHIVARYHSNSDAMTMGIESAKVMMQLRKLPKFLQRLNFKASMALQKRVLTDGTVMHEALEGMTFEDYIESINSHVYEESFWNDRIVTCPRCCGNNEQGNRFDFDDFLTLKGSCYSRVGEEQMSAIVEKGHWVCPNANCGMSFRVERQSYDQLIWWPVRGMAVTGPNGVFVERQVTYSLMPNVSRKS